MYLPNLEAHLGPLDHSTTHLAQLSHTGLLLSHFIFLFRHGKQVTANGLPPSVPSPSSSCSSSLPLRLVRLARLPLDLREVDSNENGLNALDDGEDGGHIGLRVNAGSMTLSAAPVRVPVRGRRVGYGLDREWFGC